MIHRNGRITPRVSESKAIPQTRALQLWVGALQRPGPRFIVL